MFRTLMGQKIAERRKSLRYSQEALAHESGWSRQQLSRVELGTSSIATDRLLALAEVLECEISDLLPTHTEIDSGEETLLSSIAASIAQTINDEGGRTPVYVIKRDDDTLGVTASTITGDVSIDVEEELSTHLRDYDEEEIAEFITAAMKSR